MLAAEKHIAEYVFQFYNSSIKTCMGYGDIDYSSLFQFYNSSIKTPNRRQ